MKAAMSPLSPQAAEGLGRCLHAEGFQPLPDADDGTLSGTRLWRVRAGYVEYLALRPNGLAHAVRAEARFDYSHPTEHGRTVEHRFGYAVKRPGLAVDHNNPPHQLVAAALHRRAARLAHG